MPTCRPRASGPSWWPPWRSEALSASVAGTPVKIVEVFGLPLTIFNYGSTVFPPLLMAAVLGPLYKGLRKLIPQSVQQC